ncbi:DNA mismatch endonuclease Vsr [Kocuria dechangensis]|nr:DNA mismatch endonuclease Vsr [Kocuria dechangensis]
MGTTSDRAIEAVFNLTTAGGVTVTVGLPTLGAMFQIEPLKITAKAQYIIGSSRASAVPALEISKYERMRCKGLLPLEKLIPPTSHGSRSTRRWACWARGGRCRKLPSFEHRVLRAVFGCCRACVIYAGYGTTALSPGKGPKRRRGASTRDNAGVDTSSWSNPPAGPDNAYEVLNRKDTSHARSMPTKASDRMSRQRRRDTEPEMLLRKELHRRGLRYRVDAKLPGMPRRRADVLFPRRKVAVFVDGCFWHACPLHATSPQTNSAWWRTKLEGNVARDRDTDQRLKQLGWTVLRFWEHEDMTLAADAVETLARPCTLHDGSSR